ncbi:MAG: hypothetical protein KM312_11515 [Hydrogenibacillus schlegelii]|uniref:Uncharacterized protein n=1 Tax=Hydrogenibacillus schlegelii TaxID=1484 RepID=A0A947D5Q7_HYDSH|nr:hypothetical protein [Hydrogenibacillus schlegelii]
MTGGSEALRAHLLERVEAGRRQIAAFLRWAHGRKGSKNFACAEKRRTESAEGKTRTDLFFEPVQQRRT